MTWLWNLIKAEPAQAAAVVRVTLLFLTAFGFHFTSAQMAITLLLVETVLTFLTRANVTANVNLPKEQP